MLEFYSCMTILVTICRSDDYFLCIYLNCMIYCVIRNRVLHFSPIKVKHLPRFGFDHAAILIGLEEALQWNNRKRRKLFRFEESWSNGCP